MWVCVAPETRGGEAPRAESEYSKGRAKKASAVAVGLSQRIGCQNRVSSKRELQRRTQKSDAKVNKKQ